MSLGRILSRAVMATAVVLVFGGTGANADVLYQNPDPINSSPGNVDAWRIDSFEPIFIVSDSFTLSSNSNITSIDFLSWNVVGDHISSLDWSITSLPNSGTTFDGGTTSVTDVLQSALSPNTFGFDVELNTFTLNANLAAGTYYLNLQNAVSVGGNLVGWDQGGGSSDALLDGTRLKTGDTCLDGSGAQTNGSCAETFRINGTNQVTGVPEPLTLSLFGAGLAGASIIRRRREKSH